MPVPRISHDAVVALIAVTTLPVGVLSLFFFGFEVALAVFVVGWFLLTPVVAILGEELAFDAGESEPEEDPIDELRRRYAEGEIDDAEFERRLDALVETEDLDGADPAAIERAADRIGASAESEVDVERE